MYSLVILFLNQTTIYEKYDYVYYLMNIRIRETEHNEKSKKILVQNDWLWNQHPISFQVFHIFDIFYQDLLSQWLLLPTIHMDLHKGFLSQRMILDQMAMQDQMETSHIMNPEIT